MDMKSGALCAIKELDKIQLRPRLSLGLGVRKETSPLPAKEHSFSITFGTTLMKTLAATACLLILWKAACKLKEKKMERKWRAKYKKRLKRGKKK